MDYKEETRVLKQELKNRVLGYITGGLGLVAGLAWNDAIRGLIDYWLPAGGKDSLWAKFLYAALVTLIIVCLTVYLSRLLADRPESPKNS
jgi:uncharacterized membrane protein